jgi:hypothetical protein
MIGVVFKENCVQLKTRAVAVQLVYWMCGYWRCVSVCRVIMIKVMNSDRVAWDELCGYWRCVSVCRVIMVKVMKYGRVAWDELFGYWRCVRMCRVIMIKVMNCDRVARDVLPSVVVNVFSYIISIFSMSLSLNNLFWPICTFGTWSINRHLRFSYRLTQYIQS